jgi:hypothetical protein
VCFVKRRENLGSQNLRAQIYDQGSIPDPLRRSTFNKGGGGGGGGPELSTQVSTAYIGVLSSTDKIGFRTPFAFLPLIRGGGGGSGMGDFVWVPLSSPHDCLHLSPSAICLPLYISPPLSAILAHLIPVSTSSIETFS